MSTQPVDVLRWLHIEVQTFKEGSRSRVECAEVRAAVSELIDAATSLWVEHSGHSGTALWDDADKQKSERLWVALERCKGEQS